jgi:hypothetical protein
MNGSVSTYRKPTLLVSGLFPRRRRREESRNEKSKILLLFIKLKERHKKDECGFFVK